MNQPEDGLEVLEKQARDRKASGFTIVPFTPGLSDIKLGRPKLILRTTSLLTLPTRLGLPGLHQYQNANLAVHLAQEFLRVKAPSISSEALSSSITQGLQKARWPGRCQTVEDPTYKGITWFLDGAHTKDSLECCAQWFFTPDAALRKLP